MWQLIFQVSWWWSSSRWFVSSFLLRKSAYRKWHISGFHLSFAKKQFPTHGTQVTFHFVTSDFNYENVTVRYPSQDTHGTIFKVPLQCSCAFMYIWLQNDDLLWILNDKCFKHMKNVIIALKRNFLLAKLCEVLVSCRLSLQPKQTEPAVTQCNKHFWRPMCCNSWTVTH